jgi:hypothetical protein
VSCQGSAVPVAPGKCLKSVEEACWLKAVLSSQDMKDELAGNWTLLSLLHRKKGKLKVSVVADLPPVLWMDSDIGDMDASQLLEEGKYEKGKIRHLLSYRLDNLVLGLRFWVEALQGAPGFSAKPEDVAVEVAGKYLISSRLSGRETIDEASAPGFRTLSSEIDVHVVMNRNSTLQTDLRPEEGGIAYPEHDLLLWLTDTASGALVMDTVAYVTVSKIQLGAGALPSAWRPQAGSRPVPVSRKLAMCNLIVANAHRANSMAPDVLAHELGHAALMPHTAIGNTEVHQDRRFDSIMDYRMEKEMGRDPLAPTVTPSDRAIAWGLWEHVRSSADNMSADPKTIKVAGRAVLSRLPREFAAE